MLTNVGFNGARNALKGYRVQALYTLYRVLNHKEGEDQFIPEGYEDLDIKYKSGKYGELIQVKNTKPPITLSDIITAKNTSFLRRCLNFESRRDEMKFTLVSFSGFSAELLKLFSEETPLEKLKNKLSAYSLTDNEILFLKNNVSFESFLEEEVRNSVLDGIKKFGLNVEPEKAIGLLHFWIFACSEKQRQITIELLIGKIQSLGKFIKEREEFERHYYTTIVPFGNTRLKPENIERLTEQYFNGTSASYEHILSGLDVYRDDKLDAIHEKFKSSDVVVVHGASGQGKSSLAYRYINSFCDPLAYEVLLLENSLETHEQIKALSNFVNSSDFPVYIYIDVKPGNENWVSILKEFSSSSLLKFLITIRQEDWNRTPDKGVNFLFEDLELNFEEQEAAKIYSKLIQKTQVKTFTDFEEAWLQFGGKGPLLEFTYLIKRGETLKSRLRTQIARIEAEHSDLLDLVRIVCFADAHNARVKVETLKKLPLFPKLRFAIENVFEKEYLIKFTNGGKFLTGLHPIRSSLITEILHQDDFVFQISASIHECVELIDDTDLYIFLLSIFFKYPDQADNIQKKLTSMEFQSWSAIGSALNSLLWLGVYRFVNENRAVLDEVVKVDEALILFNIWLNLTDSRVLDGSIEKMNLRDRLDLVESTLKKSKIDKSTIFNPARNWLTNFHLPVYLEFSNSHDLEALGQLLYWLSYLTTKREITFNKESLIFGIKNYTVFASSIALLGLHSYSLETKKIALDVEADFLEKLRRQYKISVLERTDTTIFSHFIIDVYTDYKEERKNTPHEIKREILECIRYGLPYLKIYGTQGYGHNFFELDDTRSNVNIEHLPIEMVTSLNSLINNLFSYPYRPNTWNEFVDITLSIRQQVLFYAETLLKGIIQYLKNGDIQSLAKICQDYIGSELQSLKFKTPLPKIASDWTGKGSEISGLEDLGKTQIDNNVQKTFVIRKFDGFVKARNSYFWDFDTFIQQSARIIFDRAGLLKESADSFLRVSVVNLSNANKHYFTFQREFKLHFEEYFDEKSLELLENKEKKTLDSLFIVWKEFLKPSRLRRIKSFKSLQLFEDVKKRFEDNLARIFRKKRKDITGAMGFTITFKPEQNHVIIFADISNPLFIHEAGIVCCRTIYDAISFPDWLSIKYLMLQNYYTEFIVVPTVFGEAINSRVFCFRLSSLMTESFENIKPYNFLLTQSDKVDFDEHKVGFWEDSYPELQEADGFIGAFSEIELNINVITHFKNIIENEQIDELGKDILNAQIELNIKRVSEAFKKFHDIALKEINIINQDIQLGEWGAETREYFEYLDRIFHAVLPEKNPSEEEGEYQVALDFEKIIKWKENIDTVRVDAQIAYYAMVKRIILFLD